MSVNARVTGKDKVTERFNKQREAALEKAARPVEKEEPKAEAEPSETPPDRAALDIDYRTAYRNGQEELKRERQRYNSLQGVQAKTAEELKTLRQQLEDRDPDILAEARKSEPYRKLVEDYDEATAESMLGLAQIVAPKPKEPEPVADEPLAVGEQYGYEDYLRDLDRALPGWDVRYNDNPEFVKWAGSTTEPLSGRSYLDLLNHAANETFDLKVARNIFSAFDRQVKQSRPRREELVEPEGDAAGKPPSEAPRFRRGDLRNAEARYRRGKMTYADFDKLRRDFQKAAMEGRVTD